MSVISGSDDTARLIEELEWAADNLAELPPRDVAMLLRRAALQLQIRPTAVDVDKALQSMMDTLDRAYDAQLRAK
ncbi:hypothetical protein [Mesorhizobium retamae]|uniref:Uncharacterized protein n=1 Tax=Mesorhizobium retamae TaxID=2912854 RepID=A0ABS9QMS6_9HYPH|nr:hypothetical protein [Mesorhizobium sp. IRAMC:0171]MCG7508747.1 hypothetical protein [Mesorhizobium sp. IRAMC:0171]